MTVKDWLNAFYYCSGKRHDTTEIDWLVTCTSDLNTITDSHQLLEIRCLTQSDHKFVNSDVATRPLFLGMHGDSPSGPAVLSFSRKPISLLKFILDGRLAPTTTGSPAGIYGSARGFANLFHKVFCTTRQLTVLIVNHCALGFLTYIAYSRHPWTSFLINR